MKTCLIIPIHKQSNNCRKIFDGILGQSIRPDFIYLIIDRATHDEFNQINDLTSMYDLNFKIIRIDIIPDFIPRKSDLPVFMAGYIRNIGIEHALKDDCEIFIFIDGDCVPQKDLVKYHIQQCDRKIPVISVGRRRESKYGWKDQREVDANLMHLNLFGNNGIVINNPELLKQSLVLWSCNVSINKSAIDLLYRFNLKYYARVEIFNSLFLGEWGGEDSFLGVTAWHCRIFISTIGALSTGIEHIDHPRPVDKYTINHKEYFDNQVDNLRKKVMVNPLPLDFF